MSTAALRLPARPAAAPRTTPGPTSAQRTWLRDAADAVRRSPAPSWGTSAAAHARHLTYVVVSMAAWVAVGLGGTALLAAVLRTAG